MTERQSGEATGNRVRMPVRVLGPADGDILGAASAVRDRFMITGKDSGGGFSLVEHLMPPRTLAAPLHRHSREDEYLGWTPGLTSVLDANAVWCEPEGMTQTAQRLLAEFDRLAEAEREEVLAELLQRLVQRPHELPTDTELVTAADRLFVALDEDEQAGADTKPR